jgi:prevent-host-death family protein
MGTVGLRELRQDASDLVRRVEAGEVIEVTVSGRLAARLIPGSTQAVAGLGGGVGLLPRTS